MPGIRQAKAAGAALAALAAVVIAPSSAAAQADFYKGRTVELIVSTGVGGGLDANARVVARHLVNHIPGQPTIVVKNMPGAGHIRAANYVFTQAPKDGTTIATFIPIFVMAQVLERSRSIQFNSAQFNWLASTSSSNGTVYVWHTSGIKSVEDATKRMVVMGATGAGSYTIIYPTVMNSLIGTRFKLVTGYQSAAEVGIAPETHLCDQVDLIGAQPLAVLGFEAVEIVAGAAFDLAALEREPDFGRALVAGDELELRADQAVHDGRIDDGVGARAGCPHDDHALGGILDRFDP